jgi:hypothetical protein
MGKKFYSSKLNRGLTLDHQLFKMNSIFPDFRYSKKRNSLTWHGYLSPSPSSPNYFIEVIYQYPRSPKVKVLSHQFSRDCPHLYSDNSLCLFYPQDRSWNKNLYISDTILPWTIEWLTLYELWEITGYWAGPEAAHTGEKNPAI